LLSFSLHFVSGKSYPAASRGAAHPKGAKGKKYINFAKNKL